MQVKARQGKRSVFSLYLRARTQGRAPRQEQTQGRKPRWSDELFQPTHTNKKTGEYVSTKAKNAQLKYEKAMKDKYGEDKEKWPRYHGDLWFTTGVDDQNAHADNYGLGALGKTRGMFRFGGSSSAQSQSYSSMPPSTHLTEEDIERISSRVLDRMEARIEARFRASSVRNLIVSVCSETDDTTICDRKIGRRKSFLS
ncbi:uncharacterized protein LOC144546623 [Carex rostrata]